MNKTITFIQPVETDIQDIEALMNAQADENHPDLRKALHLLVSAGGKRIRPALNLLTGRMFNANHERLITLSAAIELLHTATLVHDDLIDGSMLRRGIPTLNASWSPAATVLTGDFLFARAAELAAATHSIPVIKLFARTLSVIVNGEITQLFTSPCNPSRDDYSQRIYAKTASLFETSASSAAMVSEADEHSIELMRSYGYNIGMAFQIIDDILDFTGEQATIGKPVGSDLRQGLITLPTLYYLEQHPQDPTAIEFANGRCVHDDPRLNSLIEAIRTSSAIHSAHQEAVDYVKAGLDSLHRLPAHPDRVYLEDLAEYIIQRNF